MTKSNGKKMHTPRGTVPQDTTLGQKIRIRRVEQGVSQAELGDALGISFQQVQKYEKGVNRVGATRLVEIAKALEVEVNYFYGGANKLGREVEGLLFEDPKFSIRLLRAYAAVPLSVQRRVVDLLESMVGEPA